MEKIEIRPANIDDLEVITELHCSSFKPEDHIPMLFGKNYIKANYEWHIKSDMAYVLVAEIDSNIIGLVGMCDKSFFHPMFKACRNQMVIELIKKPGIILKKELWKRLLRRSELSEYGKLISEYPGMAQMTIGAVDANHRGLNIFPKLVNSTEKFSRERGSRAIRAGVYRKNSSSRRVFNKLGWIEMPELETSDTVFYVSFLDPTLQNELKKIQI